MKKILLILLVLVIPINVRALSAETAIVMDASSGRVLYGKNIDKQKLIASTTKIMTALIAIEQGNLNSEVTVSKEVLKAYGSNIYVEVGEKIKLEDLIYGLMLRSGNDAAIMIAIEVADSMENFAHLMNLKASEIGMKNSIFYNSHGLEEKNNIGNKSTAYDMAILTKEATLNPTFKKIFGTKKYVAKSSYKTYSWTNKNRLLFSYKYTTGGKTGFTDLARRTLVTTASKDFKDLIVVTLNDGNDFVDHKNLYETYFEKYDLVKVIDQDKFKINDDHYYKKETLVVKNNFNILLTPSEKKDIKTVVELEKIKWYRDNERVGTIKVYLKDKLMHEEGIYIMKENDSNQKGFWKRLWDFIKFWD